ncbi:MAG: DUF134 domain-containing protein [archaeon]|nr:DUF134 domain-containing protein [archaeon]
MPRSRRCRWVGFQPNFLYFEPRGSANPEVVVLRVEELESIRLKDYVKMEQEEAAERMGVSQPTFHRILHEARRKIAEALVEGKAIRIEGGDYVIMPEGRMPAPPPVIPPGWRRRDGGGPPF